MKGVAGILGIALLLCCVPDLIWADDTIQKQLPANGNESVSLGQFIDDITRQTKINFIVREKSFLNHRVTKRKFNSVPDILKTTLGAYNKSYIYNDSGEIETVQLLSLKENKRDNELVSHDPGPDFPDEVQIQLEEDFARDDESVVDNSVLPETQDANDVQSFSSETTDADSVESREEEGDTLSTPEADPGSLQ